MISIKTQSQTLLTAENRAAIMTYYNKLQELLPRGVCHYPPQLPYFTGYSTATLYDWDQYFEGFVCFYSDYPTEYLKNAIRIFLSRQQPDGMIYRSVSPGVEETYIKHRNHIKPFLAQAALSCFHVDGNISWLEEEGLLSKLKKYLEYWLYNLDIRGKGLSVWYDAGHTGMDNHYERAGEYGRETSFCEGVDLNSYLVRECNAFALICELLDHSELAGHCRIIAKTRRDAIQRWLWNEKDGMYYDYNAVKDEPIGIKYSGAFAPLWAEIPNSGQAHRMINEHLMNEDEFWRVCPVPGYSASEPGYAIGFLPENNSNCCSWRAHSWMPVNYYIIQGLRYYSMDQVAEKLALKSWDMFRACPFSEYYLSDYKIGTGLKPFWGWSALAIFILLEIDLDIDPTNLSRVNTATATMQKWLQQNSE